MARGTPRRRWVWLLVLGLACAPRRREPARPRIEPEGPARTFAIRFSRPAHLGDEDDVAVHFSQQVDRRTHFAGQAVRFAGWRHEVHFEARVRAVEVDARGVVVRARYQVTSARVIPEDGAPRELLPAGAVVVQSRARFGLPGSLDTPGRTLSTQESGWLGAVLSTLEVRHTDDELFGTTEPQAVGGRWRANTAALVADVVANGGFAGSPASAIGEVGLAGATRCGASDCLLLGAHVRLEGVRPRNALPEGLTLRDSHIEQSFEDEIPVDRDRVWRRSHIQTRWLTRADGAVRGTPFEVQEVMTRERYATGTSP